MDSLAKQHTRRDVRTALNNLPKELDDTYGEAMRRIRGQGYTGDVELAEKNLYWIAYVVRPLTSSEIAHALATRPEDVYLDEEPLPDEGLLISICAGLVTIDRESNIIRLIHYTTQEYFERIRLAQFPDAQTSIATTCLTYLSFNAFAEGSCRTDQELEIWLHTYPFLGYAAKHWTDHAHGDPEETIKELALNFLEHDPKLWCSFQAMSNPYNYLGYSQNFKRYPTVLHFVAPIGLARIACFVVRVPRRESGLQGLRRSDATFLRRRLRARGGGAAAARA